LVQAKGNAAFSAGNFPEAVEHFTAAIAADPSNHVLFSNRSAAYASLGQFEPALEDAKQVVELKADWPKGYSRLGAAHFGLRQWDDAVEAYSKGTVVGMNSCAVVCVRRVLAAELVVCLHPQAHAPHPALHTLQACSRTRQTSS
jgi:stress-induced-phosphoprotein 1